ncbi:MAG TPA: UDP-N-acetylmuramate dehydrogenase [Thermotogota bacterium]|nr:UDP-N-acetylmuramate dehydrogenase [Thermotogota bacterium]HRW91817.1 UDP-N-acetylmuramate dehydrogenase [Thermotogota bacterium]
MARKSFPLPESLKHDLYLSLYLAGCVLRENEPLSAHTTMGIGGSTPLWVQPVSKGALSQSLGLLEQAGVPYRLIGNGSNLLVKEEPLPFAVLDTTRVQHVFFSGNRVVVAAGVLLRSLGRLCQEMGLSGLENLSGIPGTVGGAIRTNAGAYGSHFGDLVRELCLFDRNAGKHIRFSPGEGFFQYRRSALDPAVQVVTEVVLELSPGAPQYIAQKTRDVEQKRFCIQPLCFPSAGSVFKKPFADFHVGKVVEELGLKGKRVGGAQVSEKHAGFIVNRGHATFADVFQLIRLVQGTVQKSWGLLLELEVEVWP